MGANTQLTSSSLIRSQPTSRSVRILTALTFCVVSSCKHTSTDSQPNLQADNQTQEAASTEKKTFNFLQLPGPNLFTLASISRPKDMPAPTYNICIHSILPGDLNLNSQLIVANIVPSLLVEWWSQVDIKYFPDGFTRRNRDDIYTEWASFDVQGTRKFETGKSCTSSLSWDLHVYLVRAFIDHRGSMDQTVGAYNQIGAVGFPGTASGPSLFVRISSKVIPGDDINQIEDSDGTLASISRTTILHELGHYLGLADTYELDSDGFATGRCIKKRSNFGTTMGTERHPPSIMCISPRLTEDDKKAANCMYCSGWPGGMMPPDHPCQKILQSSAECGDLSL